MEPTPTPSTSETFSESFVLPGAAPAHPPVWEPALPSSISPLVSREQHVRLVVRIVVRLHQLGPPSPDGEALPESTEEGLALALSVTRGAVSKVLTRLVAADAVGRERRHVRGRDRRLRVYFLRPRGEELARQIEQRFRVVSALSARLQS